MKKYEYHSFFLFSHSREALASNSSIRHVNRNIYKPKVGAETRRVLAESMSREIEFYNFCRQRLRKQAVVIE